MSTYAPTKEEKERFMSRAIELSAEGAFKGHAYGGPYGAVVVKNGKIVGTMAISSFATQLPVFMHTAKL